MHTRGKIFLATFITGLLGGAGVGLSPFILSLLPGLLVAVGLKLKPSILSSCPALFIAYGVILVVVLLLSLILAIALTSPLNKLLKNEKLGVKKYAIKGKGEIAQLSAILDKTRTDLRSGKRSLHQALKTNEETANALSVAAEIQFSMLPDPETVAKAKSFDLFAQSVPAKTVGGDFYDFFYLDSGKTKLACVIADVSGKGIQAALFMVKARTLLKQEIKTASNLGQALVHVNKYLCEDNPQSMFCTMFVIVIDLETGWCKYANGGHNPPLLAEDGVHYAFMKLEKATPPGLYGTSKYGQQSMRLKPGAKMYLYTDGVNEAMNNKGEQWGNESLLDSANENVALGPEEFDACIRSKIAAFVGKAEQSDDITTLSFTFRDRIVHKN